VVKPLIEVTMKRVSKPARPQTSRPQLRSN